MVDKPMGLDRIVVMMVEPSSRLSEIVGKPYLIEKRVTLRELLANGVITESDIRKMESGKTLKKLIPIKKH